MPSVYVASVKKKIYDADITNDIIKNVYLLVALKLLIQRNERIRQKN